MGMVERDGKVITLVIRNVKSSTLLPMIEKNVARENKTVVYTDKFRSYNNVERLGYAHRIVQHSAKQYVAGVAHFNTCEALWSTIKRSIDGANHHVNPPYLQSYLDSYVFRDNHRHDKTPLLVTLISRFATQK
ncbi:MAG: IS1595 family transposase [Dehalococcoidales bacterium]|nr:IS1595 family transposase [Dehalococcoidales bacterium]